MDKITLKPIDDSDEVRSLEDLNLDLQKHNLQETKERHELRKSYSTKIFWLVAVWLLCVIASLVLTGFEFFKFKLSDAVLIAFITTTTTAVLGLFVIVANWMFPKEKSPSPPPK